ncbi:MAG: Glycerol-3-phosphate transporter, partial [Pseudomonadota bacterium]
MIERRPVADAVAHIILIAGVAIVAFPLFLAFVASTQTAEQ